MSNGITILVADDHPLLLKGLVDELKEYNYNVIATAENGLKALEKIIDLNPSIALLDVEMPLLSGFEVIEKYKEKNNDTKFITLHPIKKRGLFIKLKR